MKPLVLSAGLAVTLMVTMLLGYHRLVVHPALASPRFGVVDVAEVYRNKEAEFTLMLTRASTDTEREGAMRMARSFAQRLPVALDELARECRCPVLLKSAVAASTPNMIDLTAQLRRKVEAP